MNIIYVFVKRIFSWSSFILELELITITNISQYQSAFDWEIGMLDSSAPEKIHCEIPFRILCLVENPNIRIPDFPIESTLRLASKEPTRRTRKWSI